MLESILAQQLYGGKGLGWRIVHCYWDVGGRRVIVDVVSTRQSAHCSCCGAAVRRALDTKKRARQWRHLDAWGIRTIVVADLRRVRCPHCGVRVERVPWADTGSRLTHDFERDILGRARDASIQGVCRQLGVHWTTVMRLVEKRVLAAAEKRFRRKLLRIGVDEVSYGKGQSKFLTIVWDHERGEVVWIGKGREEETLDAFFEKLGPRRSRKLVCVTMDMANGYIASVQRHAPRADIVFDRFHIERHLTNAVNEVRKKEFWRRGGEFREIIRGKKYLLLTKRRHLHWRRRPELDDLLQINRRLNAAYVLKEQFDLIWKFHTRDRMAKELERWRQMLRWKRLVPLQDFRKMLERHMDGVLAWADHHLSNASLEGNNAKVRGISQRAHGYRNPENLMMILYHASWR